MALPPLAPVIFAMKKLGFIHFHYHIRPSNWFGIISQEIITNVTYEVEPITDGVIFNDG